MGKKVAQQMIGTCGREREIVQIACFKRCIAPFARSMPVDLQCIDLAAIAVERFEQWCDKLVEEFFLDCTQCRNPLCILQPFTGKSDHEIFVQCDGVVLDICRITSYNVCYTKLLRTFRNNDDGVCHKPGVGHHKQYGFPLGNFDNLDALDDGIF